MHWLISFDWLADGGEHFMLTLKLPSFLLQLLLLVCLVQIMNKYNSVIEIDSFYCFRDNIQRKNKLKKLVIILTSRDISFILGASNYIGEIVNTVSYDFYLDTKYVSHCDRDTIQL